MEHSSKEVGFLQGRDLQRIHSSTLKVLEETGVRVDEENARKLLDDAGAIVDSKRKIVRVPQNLVEEMIKKVRRCGRLFGRNSKNDLTLKKGKFHVMTSSTGVRVLDLDTGAVRPSTKKDVEDSARLADALENFHIYSIMVDALDCPEEIMALEETDAMFNNTEKHIDTGALGTDSARDMIQMAAVVAGGIEELRKRPIIHFMQTPVSPLIHEKKNTEGILEIAKHEIPLIILNMAQAGGTSPMTIAGTLSVTNAEVLSGMLIAYLQNPNVPLIYGTSSVVLNMRRLPERSVFGLIENGLIAMGAAQLADYYRFPSLVNGFSGGWSGLDDDGPGFLWSMMAILPTLANANILYDGGLIENSKTLSYQDMIISNEITGMVLRCMRGIEVSDETLPDDLIQKVGPGGNFLAERHTLEHLRKEIVVADILDESKVKDIQEKSKEKARDLLSTHQPEPLEKSIQEELRKIIKKAWRRGQDRK